MTTYALIVNSSRNNLYGHLISMLLGQRSIHIIKDLDWMIDINIRRINATNIYVFISDVEEAGQLVTVCNKTTGINQTMPMQECFDRINDLFT